jgi:hypothetical protein
LPDTFEEYIAEWCAHSHSFEALDNVTNWIKEVGDMRAALHDSPLLVELTDAMAIDVWDGRHRIAIAHYKYGLTSFPALACAPTHEPLPSLSATPVRSMG